jgi:hypothetical protein
VGATGGEGSNIPHAVDFDRPHSERSAGRRLPRFSDDHDAMRRSDVDENSVRNKLHRRHQELRKKSGLPDPDYYKELKASYGIEDDRERVAQQAEIKKKYRVEEGLPQTLRKVVPGYAKREIDKKMDAGKFGKTDADKDANFQRYKKIQDKLKEQGVAESSITPDVTVDKVHDDGHEKEWHVFRGKEMIGYVIKNQPDTSEGLYIAYGHGPGRAYVEEFRGLKSAVNYITSLKEGVAEAGPFSYGAKKPRKGSVADLAAKKRKEQEKGKQPIEPRDQMVGVAKVITNEEIEGYLEEMNRAGYDIVTEAATLCPECGGPAYNNQMLAEKQDACYHKVKSRYKVWPSAYASGALVRCRKKGAKNWGNKSKK